MKGHSERVKKVKIKSIEKIDKMLNEKHELELTIYHDMKQYTISNGFIETYPEQYLRNLRKGILRALKRVNKKYI